MKYYIFLISYDRDDGWYERNEKIILAIFGVYYTVMAFMKNSYYKFKLMDF
jgi:hypothetical protein